MSQSESKTPRDVGVWLKDYGDELMSWAYYKTSNKEIAEDLVQDTFLSAHNSIKSFKEKSNPKTWLFTILNNKIIDYYRSAIHKRNFNETQLSNEDSEFSIFDQNDMWKSSSVSNWDDEPHLLDRPEFLKVLESCLDKLPEKYKAVTLAKYFHHKKGKLICQELDISPSNLWQIVHRSKLQLKSCLDVNWKSNE